MSWLSFFRKSKQETAPDESEFYSHAEEIPAPKRGRGRSKTGDDTVDPILPEKKRARRRLVGAVAIALALVIVLPIVLDSEPKPVAGDVTIHIPSRDKASKMAAARSASTPADVQASSPSASAASVPATPENVPVAPAAAPPAPATVAASVAQKANAVAASKPVKAAEEDAIGKLVKAAETKPADTKLADTKSGKFVIQVAALASKDKVKELRGKLEKAGLKTTTQIVPTKDGDRIRVRVGPYASKDEAEKVCPKLSKMDLKCTVLSN